MQRNNISQGDWPKVKSEIQKTWSGLDADELERTEGNFSEISDILQRKYGLRQDEVDSHLERVIGGRTEDALDGQPSYTDADGNGDRVNPQSAALNTDFNLNTDGQYSGDSQQQQTDEGLEQLPRQRDMGSSSSASSRGDWEEASPRQDFSEEKRLERDSYKESRDASDRWTEDGSSSGGRRFSGDSRDDTRGLNPQVNRGGRGGTERGGRSQLH